MIDEVLRHSPHPVHAMLTDIQRQCDASIIKRSFSQDERIRAQVRGWYIFPCSNPISSHELSSAIPTQAAQKPKPCVLAHFITPVIRPLLPHRTTCSVPFRLMPTLLSIQLMSPETAEANLFLPHVRGNLHCLSSELALAA